VDNRRFSPIPDSTDGQLRTRLNLPAGTPVFLAIGGVEERKNSLAILRAFQLMRSLCPASRLVIAGGASLLDHDSYQARFATALAQSNLPSSAVIQAGPLPQVLMPALYRAATSLVFPSTREGFGLEILEAMACGLPAIVSRIAPFTEYLNDSDVLWCNPFDASSIAASMARSLDESSRAELVRQGLDLAARHNWAKTARAHFPVYDELRERIDA
jgi:glycosyltransferase involved in cell wall biosynthesis